MKTENSKLSGYLLIAVFVVPLLIAIALYVMRDYLPTTKAVSHGELIHPAQPIKTLSIQLATNKTIDLQGFLGKWTYIVYSPNGCDLQCEASLFKLRQTKKATGRESNRIQSALLTNINKVNTEILQRNQHTHVGRLVNFEIDDEPGLQKKLEHGVIYLIDPIGNLMMKYDTSTTSRGMLKDIKKLLKISNIG
jgi:cytochrome oxidase Cu insertion factor (SCO1/SenC/PrrC family)